MVACFILRDDTGRIAMLEERTVGSDSAPATLQRYIYSNHLSTASLELDENAAIISYEEYHPYGTTSYQAMNSSINAVAKRYRYTGKERDEETGLYYHGARYYIPWLCRWSAVDPMESKYAGMSSYNYGFNNPIRFADRSGKEPDPVSTATQNTYTAPDDKKVTFKGRYEAKTMENDEHRELEVGGYTDLRKGDLVGFTIFEGEQSGVYNAFFSQDKNGEWKFGGYRTQEGRVFNDYDNDIEKEGEFGSSAPGGGGAGSIEGASESGVADSYEKIEKQKNKKDDENNNDSNHKNTSGSDSVKNATKTSEILGKASDILSQTTYVLATATDFATGTKMGKALAVGGYRYTTLPYVKQVANVKDLAKAGNVVKVAGTALGVAGFALNLMEASAEFQETGAIKKSTALDLLVTGTLLIATIFTGGAALFAIGALYGLTRLLYSNQIDNFIDGK